MKEIHALLRELQKGKQQLIDDVVGNGKDIYEIRSQLAATKSNFPNMTGQRSVNQVSSVHRNEGFIKATGRRKATMKPKQQPKIETTTRNRFSVLSDVEEETVLIGDSMVRDQGKHFGLRNQNKRKIRTYPGAGAKKIEDEVGKLGTKNRKTTIIVQAGGNDLFLRNGNAGPTEPLVEHLKRTVETVHKKTDNGIIIGLLPRLNVSHYALSKAIGINDRLKSICQGTGVRFINFWDTFIGNRKLYRRDGIHFSEEGMRVFGNLLSLNLYNHLENTADMGVLRHLENSSKENLGTRSDAIRTQKPTEQGNL